MSRKSPLESLFDIFGISSEEPFCLIAEFEGEICPHCEKWEIKEQIFAEWLGLDEVKR